MGLIPNDKEHLKIPIFNLYVILNKYFNTINVLKRHKPKTSKEIRYPDSKYDEELFFEEDYSRELRGEDLLTFAKRCTYILLNSIAYFETDNPIDENIAMNFPKKKEGIPYAQSVQNNIKNSSNTYKFNIKPLVDKKEYFSITNEIYKHPLIKYILGI